MKDDNRCGDCKWFADKYDMNDNGFADCDKQGHRSTPFYIKVSADDDQGLDAILMVHCTHGCKAFTVD